MHRACGLPVAGSMVSGSSTKQTTRSKGSAGFKVAAAVRHGDAARLCWATGASRCARSVCYHSGIVPSGALILSVYTHTGAGLTQDNSARFASG